MIMVSHYIIKYINYTLVSNDSGGFTGKNTKMPDVRLEI